MKIISHAAAVVLLSGLSLAQTVLPRPSVSATGRASVVATPDQARIDATVTVQAPTAQEATAQNATRTAALLEALRKVIGANGDIRTTSVYVTPVYRTQQGQAPTITAYSASNSIEITLNILSLTGQVIDTASQSGATNVGGLRFSLKNSEPAYQQALRMATQQAKAHADAMAAALGRVAGNVISVQESGASPVFPVLRADAGAATPTPVLPGTLDVSASVLLIAELN